MSRFIGYFIKYPVAVNIFIIGFFIFGYLGYQKLNSSLFPLSDPSLIAVSVTYPGASPEEVEEGVVEKIERSIKGVEGIDQVTSVSQENLGTVTIEVLSSFDINLLTDEVKNAVDRIASFPADIEPPVIEQIKPTRESLIFSLSGEGVPLTTLKHQGQEIEDDLLAMPGISDITLAGFPEEEIEIAIDEHVLRRYNITFDEVSQAIAGANILISGGSIKGASEEFLIRASNKNYYAKDLGSIVVKSSQNGGKVYLRDIAELKDTFEESPERVTVNGKEAIIITLTNTNSEDLIGSATTVKDYIERYNAQHENLQLTIIADSSEAVESRISLLVENAVIGILLVLLLLSFFLRPRVAFWVAFGLPISFFGMFILLGSFGVTLNMLSLFGMILVIGILVDDGIVIGENIYARAEKGDAPFKAALRGTMDVMVPILAAITTTILAFTIFLFLDGSIGSFFADIAIVVTLTLLVSLVEALLILPAHLAHSKDLKTDKNKKTFRFNLWGERIMTYLRDRIYSPSFKFALKHKFLSLSIVLFLFIITMGGLVSGLIGVTFFPRNASNTIQISLNTPQGTSEYITDSIATMIETKAWEVNDSLGPNLIGENHISNTIKQIGPGSSAATLTINLAPSEDREYGSPEIADRIRDLVGNVPILEKLSFNSGSNVGGSPISISIEGKNQDELKAARDMMYEELGKNPDVKDIVDSSPDGIKEIRLTLKDNAELLGLTLNSVMAQVRNAFYGQEVQRLQRGQNEIKVWVRYTEGNRTSVRDIENIRISTQNGRIPLSQIANYTIERGEVAINHKNGKQEITIEADLANPNASASAIMSQVKGEIGDKIIAKYPGVSFSSGGQNREVEKIADSAAEIIPAILFLIYLVLVFSFRSYSQPILLIALVPFTAIGVAWGHYIHGFPLNILSYLGIIGLVGIVVNDGLVFTGRFNTFLKEGLSFNDALYETGRARFRAIFLTSITTIAGLAPLMLEKSLQAQFLIPMAISISYGIAVATVLTLYLLPIFLSLSNSVKVRMAQVRTGVKPSREEVERAVKELKAEHEEI